MQLAGFPISGLPYDEYIPRDEDMHSLPESLRMIFGVYQCLRDTSQSRNGRVSWSTWIHHFTDRIKNPMEDFASFDDPLGIKESVVYVETPPECTPLDSLGFDREVTLIAFLS